MILVLNMVLWRENVKFWKYWNVLVFVVFDKETELVFEFVWEKLWSGAQGKYFEPDSLKTQKQKHYFIGRTLDSEKEPKVLHGFMFKISMNASQHSLLVKKVSIFVRSAPPL